ncbi:MULTISPECIES: hypothetical protein [Streptomyces]|uniref:hypothetical protein n=1 Tax=Streptomyces TaxID=1883 RepID=UPI000D1BE88C|nr:hypothetical protein [Streptomyces milbemycinicus]
MARVEALSCLRSAGVTVSGMRRYLDLSAATVSAWRGSCASTSPSWPRGGQPGN